MKQIAILSGKGGTGKTTFTAAMAMLMKDGVLADCDVDAPDLHLLLEPEILEEEKFSGLKMASIDPEKCTKCMECRNKCKFGAITDEPRVNPLRCEGCGVCFVVCPVGAVTMSPRDSGRLYVSDTRAGTMVHARLNIAEEATGKLVTKVRERARKIAEDREKAYVLIDGPPGVGCPVIATLGGVDLVVVITEPTVSGKHDLERIIGTAKFFKVPVGVVVNKHDLNPAATKDIEGYCRKKGIELLGRIPYNESITKAMVQGKTVLEGPENAVTVQLRAIWARIVLVLQ